MKAPKERGPALVEFLVATLAGPDSPIGDPTPLAVDALAAAEHAAGVAWSPAMAALLAFDRGWIDRKAGWFDDRGLVARPAADVVEEWSGPFWPAWADLFAARFPGRVLPLDRSDETFRFLYLGDPDPFGEYPVLLLDQDDTPVMAVEAPGFDVWLGRQLGVLSPRAFAADAKTTAKRLWNRQTDLETWDVPKRLPTPVAGPAPGSVSHAPIVPPAPKKARKLSDAQVTKGIAEHAESGNLRRMEELIADAAVRGLGTGPLDAALCAAAHHDQPEAVAKLLEAGADPNARDRYGAALGRAMWTRDDTIHDLLLARGANPNGPSVNGQTVLHLAVERGRESLVGKLLAAGGNPNRRDIYDHTPLHAAVSASTPEPVPPIGILERLLAAGAEVATKVPILVHAIEHAPDDYVHRLIAAGADPNATAVYLQRTALHAAFERCRDGLAPALIAAGADRTLTDERGIHLDEVYGPAGEDVRPLEVRWADVPDQQLTVRVRLAVVNPYHTETLVRPSFRFETWQNAGAAGLVGGARVSGTSVDLAGAKGICERRMVLDLEGASPTFVRWLLVSLLSEATGVFTGAGMDPIVRVIGLWAEGSAPGATSISRDDVRAGLHAPWELFRGVDLPFPVTEGDAPGIEVQPVAPPTVAQVAAIEAALRAWDGTRGSWQSDGPVGWMLDWMPATTGEWVGLRLIDVAGSRKAPSPWSYRAGPREALTEVLAAIHAEIPLAGARVTFP